MWNMPVLVWMPPISWAPGGSLKMISSMGGDWVSAMMMLDLLCAFDVSSCRSSMGTLGLVSLDFSNEGYLKRLDGSAQIPNRRLVISKTTILRKFILAGYGG